MDAIFSFEGLKVYQVARQLVKEVYLLQNLFPKEERYALGDQVRRALRPQFAEVAKMLSGLRTSLNSNL